jgi:hypothetical protein
MRRVMSRPAEISERLDPEAGEVIAAAISPDRAARPATARQLAERIEALSPE